ncbi:hypothetical protein [Motiliproteus sp. MSK22-1]|uniref:hypothetical protein n=1 Tax=Motiliproteus sp. MSK22-1 TaxID=1897630 RepID=UPI0009789EF9|nr:hypothetical protein [Motiliproteus sp. MSK22-1]OMH38926.1 hypothetical protein BGP75_00710 [Motiliproteus sp. MSK22-1]
MSCKSIGVLVSRVSLIVAITAYVLSIAPFTPAIFLSVLAFFGAILGVRSGAYRTATLTVYVVGATFLVSPSFRWAEQYVDLLYLISGLAVFGIALAVALYRRYQRAMKDN